MRYFSYFLYYLRRSEIFSKTLQTFALNCCTLVTGLDLNCTVKDFFMALAPHRLQCYSKLYTNSVLNRWYTIIYVSEEEIRHTLAFFTSLRLQPCAHLNA